MNYEMETLPTLEEMHDVSEKTLNTLKTVMFKQDAYGINKYKVVLKHTHQYDWLQMFLEEMADGLKYIQNEIDRKQQVIVILESALSSETPKKYIYQALEYLKLEGTGK